MEHPPEGMRLCPTRVDLADTLFAHLIDAETCQKRQREHYHKCPTCKHLNERAAAAPKPAPREAV